MKIAWRHSLRKIQRAIQGILTTLDVLLLILSPLVIILFVVLVIVLLDSFGTHWRYLNRLAEQGSTAWGVMVESFQPDDEEEVYLAIRYPTPQNNDEIGLLRMAYYSKAELLRLHEGDVVKVRYLPDQSDVTVMLEDSFSPLSRFLLLNRINLILLVVCWAILAWHPEFLYLGFITRYDPFRRVGKNRV